MSVARFTELVSTALADIPPSADLHVSAVTKLRNRVESFAKLMLDPNYPATPEHALTALVAIAATAERAASDLDLLPKDDQ